MSVVGVDCVVGEGCVVDDIDIVVVSPVPAWLHVSPDQPDNKNSQTTMYIYNVDFVTFITLHICPK